MKKYICKYCSKELASKSSLNNHIKTVMGQVLQNLCGEIFCRFLPVLIQLSFLRTFFTVTVVFKSRS